MCWKRKPRQRRRSKENLCIVLQTHTPLAITLTFIWTNLDSSLCKVAETYTYTYTYYCINYLFMIYFNDQRGTCTPVKRQMVKKLHKRSLFYNSRSQSICFKMGCKCVMNAFQGTLTHFCQVYEVGVRGEFDNQVKIHRQLIAHQQLLSILDFCSLDIDAFLLKGERTMTCKVMRNSGSATPSPNCFARAA